MNLNLEKLFSKSILLAGFIATASAGPIYDLVSDFSTASNPNGVWSYAYSAAADGTGGTAFSNVSGLNFALGWTTVPAGAIQFTQSILGNQSGGNDNAGAIVTPPNTLNMNPDGTDVEVVFTAPAAGSYTIAGTFLDDDLNVVTHPVEIFDNGVAIFSSTISTTQTSDAFNLTESLNQSDTIDFFVTIGGSLSTFTGDFNTRLRGTITQNATTAGVPEPAAFALLGAGLAGLSMLGWRRRRSAR